MKTFQLERLHDQSGVSGTGVVLEGVIFSSGQTVIRWLSERASVVIWDTFDDFLDVHVRAHPENKTIIRFSTGEIWRNE